VNVWLAAFNMIPAFPMDGGRVLARLPRPAHRRLRGGHRRAAAVGRAVALVLGAIGLFNPDYRMLVLIALFVWLSAAGEAGAVQESAALSGVGLEQVMITDVRTLAPGDPLGPRAPSWCSPASSRTSRWSRAGAGGRAAHAAGPVPRARRRGAGRRWGR
jgi:hypothetical protein